MPGSYDLDYRKIGERLQVVRVSQHISQTDIAKDIGVTSAYVSSLERGKTKLNLKTLLSYSRLCNVPADTLVRIGMPE